jgi:hypothetical protein
MADKKISALTAATTPLAGTEVLPIVQSGATVQVSVANLTAGRAISATAVTASTGDITSTAGNFVVGTSGKGIDFSATPGTGTSELLNDYEEGTWTPVLTFQTPGNLSVAYSGQIGSYTRIGNRVVLQGFISTTTFTHTTASGYVRVNGIPFNCTSGANRQNYGALLFANITKAGYTNFVTSIEPGVPTSVLIYCSGSAVSPTFITATEMPTGNNVSVKFTMTYEV